MIQQLWLFAISMPSFHSQTLECVQENISCCYIKTADGFKFEFGPPGETEISEIYVDDNETMIAYAKPNKQIYQLSSEVVSMDNGSVVRRNCRDTKIKHILLKGEHVTEHCVDYTTEKMKPCDPTDLPIPPWCPIISVLVAVLCGVMLWRCCISWRKYLKRKQYSEASLLGFFRYLRTSCGHTQLISLITGGKSGEISANLNAPDVNRVPNHRAMNRNIRDDPGGETRGQYIAWSSECHNSKDHVIDGQPLLSNEKACFSNLNTAGVSVAALVNKGGSDPAQNSRCSNVPGTDVKSMTPNMMNHE